MKIPSAGVHHVMSTTVVVLSMGIPFVVLYLAFVFLSLSLFLPHCFLPTPSLLACMTRSKPNQKKKRFTTVPSPIPFYLHKPRTFPSFFGHTPFGFSPPFPN